MKCKICSYENKDITYRLVNANLFVCENCSFHYSRYLDKEELKKTNFNVESINVPQELSAYLRNQLQHNNERFENHCSTVNKYLPASKSKHKIKILDIGSGGGIFLSKMKAMGMDCYGIELDEKRLKFSVDEYGLKNIFPYPLQSEFWMDNHRKSFDIITLWDVIEHVNSPRQIFDFSQKLLKDDGLLIIDTPCRDTFYHKFGELSYKLSFGKFPSFLNIMYSDHPFGHKQIFSKNDIKTLFFDYNFDVLHFSIFHELSFPTDYYLKKMIKDSIFVDFLSSIVKKLIKISQIKNKMAVVGKLKRM